MNRTLIMRIGGALVVVAILGLLIPVIGPWVGLGSALWLNSSKPTKRILKQEWTSTWGSG
jgi:hypothetical protein